MKKKILLLFVALLGLSWFSTITDIAGKPGKIAEHVEKAQEYEAKGIYIDAIEEYKQALTYRPGDLEISMKMAEDYLKIGKTKEYVSLCKDLAEQNPYKAEPMDNLMQYYVDEQDEADAIKYLQEYAAQYEKSETAQKWLKELKGSYAALYCRYEEMSPIINNSMVVKTENGYGICDSLGNEILEPVYEEAHPFSDSALALVRKDGTYFYVDKDGLTRLVPDETDSDLGMLTSDRTVAARNGKYGYLDEKLDAVGDFTWDSLSLICDKTGAGEKNGKWALVDKNGEAITDFLYDDVVLDENGFCSGQKRIFVKQGKAYQMVNTKNETVGELTFENAKCFSDKGYAAVCQNGKWGFVNADGEIVIDCQFDDAQSFSNGFAAVCQNRKWGYIDESESLVVKTEFEEATPISAKGTASVLKDGEWNLIQLNWFQ